MKEKEPKLEEIEVSHTPRGVGRRETFFVRAGSRSVSQQVSKPSFYKSQETAPNVSQCVSKPQWKKLTQSRLQFLSDSFYVPELYSMIIKMKLP